MLAPTCTAAQVLRLARRSAVPSPREHAPEREPSFRDMLYKLRGKSRCGG